MDVAVKLLFLALLAVWLAGAWSSLAFLRSARRERNRAMFWWDFNFWPYRDLEERFGPEAAVHLRRSRWTRTIFLSLILVPLLVMLLAAGLGAMLQKFEIVPAN